MLGSEAIAFIPSPLRQFMAAIMPVAPQRLASLARLRCTIFQTSYNPTSTRTGAKYLRARLRGPSMVEYYPEELSVARFNRMNHGEWKIVDPLEDMRLNDVEEKKKRGKGAPKKAKSKGQYIIRSPISLQILMISPLAS